MRSLLKPYIEKRLISEQTHPSGKLFIYNYTPKVQFVKLWDEFTLQCRGLILDESGAVVARPFKKFFNLEEHQSTPEIIPNEPFEVYDKLDGSLGILYWHGDLPYIATRGSFTSEQSEVRTRILYSKYGNLFDKLDRSKTYLFEIIYPAKRIVVDYGKLEDLILLTVIDYATGEESLPEIGFPAVKRYDGISDFRKLRELERENAEGFVIRFASGFRVKMKFAEYCRLHRLITQVSSRAIWETLSSGNDIEILLDRVPDEFYTWVRKTEVGLLQDYFRIENEARATFKDLGDRKETALYYQTQKHPSVLFKMLDKQDYSHIIWKIIKPKYERPFKAEV